MWFPHRNFGGLRGIRGGIGGGILEEQEVFQLGQIITWETPQHFLNFTFYIFRENMEMYLKISILLNF